MRHITDHDFRPILGPPVSVPPPPPESPPSVEIGRSWPVKKIVAGAAILLLGVGIGASSSSGDDTKDLAQIRADRDSAVATLVDVRAQSAKDLAAAQAKTSRVDTVTKEVTPPGCIKALDLAGQVIDISSDQAGNLGAYFNKIAALADGEDVLDFLQGMTSATKTLTAQTNAAAARVDAISPSYKAATAACRSAG